jgi:glutamate-5-semialdehyde dehydrogenase
MTQMPKESGELELTIARLTGAARAAGRAVAKAGPARRAIAIRGMAEQVRARKVAILAANARDLEAATAAGTSGAMLDRLKLDPAALEKMALALEEVAGLPDPVGEVVRMWRRPNGLQVGRQRIPLGVIAMIYESRPNVTTDAAALCLKAGNAVILRGGSEAFHSNTELARAIDLALAGAGLPAAAVQLVPTTDRAALVALLKRDQDVDLVIPRGGEGLIRFVAETSRIPVIKHYKGVCHIFVEASADIEAALAICHNAKVPKPSACNSVETILIQRAIAPTFVPRLAAHLGEAGVELRGDDEARALAPAQAMTPATEADWAAEYLDLVCAVRVVGDLDEAIAHIERYGSLHTESILTRDYALARRFVDEVDSSTVMVNASTRFADGGELGLGAEIGISTTRLHAYGPMGIEELTTTKFVVYGDGQIRRG